MQRVEESDIQYQKEWYIDDLLKISEQNYSDSNIILSEIYKRFNTNRNHNNKRVLDESDYALFLDAVAKCLQIVPAEELFETDVVLIDGFDNPVRLPNFMKREFFRMKYPGVNEYLKNDNDQGVCYFMDTFSTGSVSSEKVKLRSIQFLNKKLYIEGFFSGRQFLDKGGDLYVSINGNQLELIEAPIQIEVKFFGHTYHRDYSFKLCLETEDIKSFPQLSFHYSYDGVDYICPISFERPQAKLYTQTKCNYWIFDDKMLVYKPSEKTLAIMPKKNLSIFIKEICIFLFLPFTKYRTKRKLYFFYMRLMYWLTKSKYGKRKIWLYSDKIYKGGDNGEYLFRYALSQNDVIDHYYIINHDAPEAESLKKEGLPILEYKTRRSKILALHSDEILATYVNALGSVGLTSPERSFFSNLFNMKISCIQHGLTIQHIPDLQARSVDNIVDYFCASKYELRNLELPEYDYNKSQLHLTGIPRYDGLISSPKKIILIAPTWRWYIADQGRGKGNPRQYTEFFKDSEYYRIYQGLINNIKLLDFVKKMNMNIIFLLHPAISEQAEDFEAEERVSILKGSAETNYETLLREANILVTDYSGIQYDFAYMKKPVMYYHPKSLPPHYDSKVFDYETDGFGPVVDTEEKLVDTIMKCVESGGNMDTKHAERVDNFFAYSDHNNCKRIYDYLIRETDN